MKRRTRFHYPANVLVLSLIICAFARAAGAVPKVQQLLPETNTVKGWSILPNSLQYGKERSLSNIYDGGYELYTKNGTIDAARQMYQRDGNYVEITIHSMKSEKASSDFLEYWRKQFKAKTFSKDIRAANFLIDKPNVARYFATGRYFVTVVAFYAIDKATKDTAEFMIAIDKTIRSTDPVEQGVRTRNQKTKPPDKAKTRDHRGDKRR